MSSFNEGHRPETQLTAAFDSFADALFRHCYFRLNDREAAKDLVQQTFMKTWDYLAQGKTIENFRAFLYATAHNLIINERKRRRALSLETVTENSDWEPVAPDSTTVRESQDAAQRLIEELKRLNEEAAQLVTLRYVDDLAVADIARLLGETENTIAVRLHRALKLLRTIAEPKQDHD
jgi:RNA polymerase sigma-70 factor (ECF subfamily)